ncbi:flagellar hook-associated protein 2 [Aquibacillus sp. 3ASR75-11]|uniref:Flagellar hook-associated protein 2 n=2 Tax=Terrihalobacillus insolitus TaxID=2950438 RepID=A0A9X3WQM1_9BACI|nr:flagellar hook-associated protein 2 [Terrihalobacillus insolitus]MDC3423073.1 flagellar hook-associated protein 2 [Terrihalobacillus insolitus]
MVKDLMKAERLPLDKMQQDKTWMTWQRDAYRDVNKMFYDLDQKMLDMKLERTYNSKTTTSTSDAVTATATASASNGTYNIEVAALATSAINVSQNSISGSSKIDPTKALKDQDFAGTNITNSGTFNISFFNEDGTEVQKNISYDPSESLNTVLKRIEADTNNEIRAFYDSQTDKVVLERTKTGDFNKSDQYLGAEIGFDGQSGSSFLTDTLQIKNGQQDASGVWQKVEEGGTNAAFTYNNMLDLESTDNSYTLNGITYNFTNTNVGNPAKVTVNNDVDAGVEKIVAFVNKYNELIEKVNGSLQEERYRDFKPLTDKQKEEMSDKEVELWEEKAKSGLLRSDNILASGLFDMRQNWYAEVDNSSNFDHLSEIGIKTSSDYRDAGKLIVTEDDLRKSLREDPESVYKLFSNDVKGDGRGIINRLEDSMERTMENVEERAGKGTQTLEQYTIGKRLRDLNSRIDSFQDKMIQVEDRYWRQFTQMEKAMQQMNQQSAYLMQQFGG